MNDQAHTPAELRATFEHPAQMQDAANRLALAGFDRAEMSLPEEGESEVAADPVNTEEDARQLRTLESSTAATVGALAAAGITVATGGAAAPAVAAAVLAGGAAGGATFAARSAASNAEQDHRVDRSMGGHLVLTVRSQTSERKAKAEEILRAAGATTIDFVS